MDGAIGEKDNGPPEGMLGRNGLTPNEWLISLDSYSNETYGRSITSAVAANGCVSCGAGADRFFRSTTRACYPRTGLCERCQERSGPDVVLPFTSKT